MSYCIAFSIDGATDVTRRYVRGGTRHGAPRNKAPEEVLLWVIHEIRRMRREKLSKKDRRRRLKEDDREERELRGYMAQAITAEINGVFSSSATSSSQSDEVKVPVTRQNGTVEWVDPTPGQTGQPNPDRRSDGR